MTTAEAGLRLDRFLEQELAPRSRPQIKRLIEQGHVQVAGRRVKAGWRLRDGEWVEATIPDPPKVIPEPEDLPLEVVYEDDALLVVEKPAGLVVHPGAGRPGGTLVNALLGRGVPLSDLGAPQRPGIVHRLDKGTSGLLMVAKTDAAHRSLSGQLERREVTRRYWALIWGTLGAEQGRIDGALARSRSDRRRMRVVTHGGRAAATRYAVCWQGRNVSALRLALETGRTHQIRVHLKHMGHPVFGDPEYGGRGRGYGGLSSGSRDRIRRALKVLDRQALHAGVLAFAHPVSGQPLGFQSPLPHDMVEAADILEVPVEARTLGGKEIP